MLLEYKDSFVRLEHPENPKHLVFCDFDETYFPHVLLEEHRRELEELETFIERKSREGELMIGWVSGSKLEDILNKMNKGKFRIFPHFIASDLGTELTYMTWERYGTRDEQWDSRLTSSGFSEEAVGTVVRRLSQEHGVELTPQTQLGSSRFKWNFYYWQKDPVTDRHAVEYIRRLAGRYRLDVNINRCNPLAGDPEDCYDVDFIPLGTGKAEIVRFMLGRYGVGPEHAFAFGDSGNDLLMLQAVRHGYLVHNATEEAKGMHPLVSEGAYVKGILHVLQEHLQAEG
ncbi:HAD-IIB family hydrolase [Paenibacillus sp. UNC499MF]|uniref:HAD-IIB family hydrolase n=1 Tax=Paenibacillus sp. UNC499MF TaxID=1502751 RepID=UPI00089FF54D|nr:HAD-IIB family hydrolase [Paenibacillus sp. UNC499MF]SEF42908.1 kanosamine-6-phosphate phosphatase [Paenibacillus sp. UNC499MF]